MDFGVPHENGRAAAGLLSSMPTQIFADEFEHTLGRIDQALQTNPNHVVQRAMDTCMSRRMHAVRLYRGG
jgi:hypothetical protein